MKTSLITSDTDFASALLARGAKLVECFPSDDDQHKRMLWRLTEIEPAWIEDYRTGRDGFSSFVNARKMLINMVKTDPRMKNQIKEIK